MKIGILTHPIEVNYGGTLQAFALQKVLKDLGHDVYTIDRHNKRSYPSIFRHVLGYVKRLYLRYFHHKNISAKWNPFMSDEEYQYISRKTQLFIKKNIKLTRKIYNSELKSIEEEYKFDAYIVGSDQVWLPSYCPNSFLDFVTRKNVIKLFYAASSGSTTFANDTDKLKQCKELVKDFKKISVRESKLISLCKKKLNVDAELVLDPTLLLQKEDYISLLPEIKAEKDILFSYILDKTSEKEEIIKLIGEKYSLKVREGNVPQNYVKTDNIDLEKCTFPSIESWIEGYANADYIITDSFHGTVFSIIFNKQFLVIGNKERGMDRFISLLSLFNLQDRLVCNKNDVIKQIGQSIKYSEVNKILKEYQILSKNFLIDNLK